MLDSFQRSYTGCSPLLEAALQSGNLAEAAHQAHAVKGAAATIGAKLLADTASRLEQACKGSATTAELSTSFQSQLAEVLTGISAMQAG